VSPLLEAATPSYCSLLSWADGGLESPQKLSRKDEIQERKKSYLKKNFL
jgi:hypothetical protein